MKVLVVLVNYRTAPDTVEAVHSVLEDVAELDASVVLVDNDSRDGSLTVLNRELREAREEGRVRVIASAKNGGFGAGNNLAIADALRRPDAPDVFFFVNPDARLYAGATPALLDVFRRFPHVGIAGARLCDPDGTDHVAAFRFPSPLGELDTGLRLGIVTRLLDPWVVAVPGPARTGPVDWVSGASFAVRRAVFERVGLFDEGFFLYFEETDLCHRARRAGFQTWHVHEARVEHSGAVSTGLNRPGARMPSYWFLSRRRYFLKNRGRLALWSANALFASGYALWRLRRRIQHKPDTDPPHFLSDFLRHNLLPPPEVHP
jgi:N-acetylglucosaminyl-diphospho-decaprenol L-rhamnosyltransferase